MCLDGHMEADVCTTTTVNGRYSLKTKDPAFHANSTCAALGFEACPERREGIEHYKPCSLGDGTTKPKSKTAVVAKPFVLPPPGNAGPAYIALQSGVALFLPDGTPQLVSGLTEWIPLLVLGTDGAVYASPSANENQRASVYRIDGATATKVATFKAYGISALAVSKDGVIYGADEGKVMRSQNGSVVSLPATGLNRVDALSFDADGVLVAAGGDMLKRFHNDAWETVNAKLTSLKLYGSGASLLVASGFEGDALTLATLRDGTLVPAYPGVSAPYLTTLTANGILVSSESVDQKRQPRVSTTDGGSQLVTTTTIEIPPSATVDNRGRAWFVESAGLHVVSLLDNTSTTYPIGTLPTLTKIGSSSLPHEIVVVGAGPTALAPAEAPRLIEKVTATIIVGSSPLANTDMLLCTNTISTFHSNPCELTSATFRGRTDDKGGVTFENVPVGNYQLAFKEGSQWTLPMSTFLELYTPEPSKDLGKLRYR
jgi:hypothetical protein